MHRGTVGVAAFAVALAMAGMPGWAADLALKRVVLSTGGVGYFEYQASVDGDATLALDVPLDQVDDVLKSLVVYDGSGQAGEITLPGREPLAQSLADLPFGQAALQSEVALLNAAQGAEIRVAAPQAIAGRLLHAETETVAGPSGLPVSRTRVSVLTDKGLQRFPLDAVGAIAFADPVLQRQVGEALQRIAADRDTGRRELRLQVSGGGKRLVRVGYVVAMPLWKATYRLSLPADPAAQTARLQGWAVLENFSGRPWNGIELSLVSGNPVTFRQALYESYYVQRPSVPVESGMHVLPSPDTGTVAAQMAGKAGAPAPHAMRMAPAAAAPANMAEEAVTSASPPPAPARINPASPQEGATQVAFTPPYPVSVAAGQSLMLPLLDRELPARRIDLYQPSAAPRHPLAAIELKNDSGTGLPPGVLTLYQQHPGGADFVGDARLASFPAGDRRLLSYAIDGKVNIDRTTGERRPVVKATIAEGVLHLTRADRWTTRYRIKSVATFPVDLLIEHLRRPGAVLTSPDPKSVELTAAAYRIPFALPAGGQGDLSVVEEHPVVEAIRLLDVADNQLGALVASGELDPRLREALQGVAQRRQAVARLEAELARLRQRHADLTQDEKRLRDNLAVLGNDPDLRKHMLDRFAAAETAIEGGAAATAKTSDALAAAERDLNTYVSSLTL